MRHEIGNRHLRAESRTALYWLEQTEADLPNGEGWLSEEEASHLHALRFAKRRADWRLGRWTAKRAIAFFVSAPQDASSLATIEIRPAVSGAPQAFWAGKPAQASISLSHRGGVAACVVTERGIALGCDVELIEPHSEAFVADYFTEDEQDLIASGAADRAWLVPLLWSAKESALKATGAGLRADTRSVSVRYVPCDGTCAEWCPIEVCSSGGTAFHGWWRRDDIYVRTAVSLARLRAPIQLEQKRISHAIVLNLCQ